ncbi:MAG: TonB-dependent receptor [Verrucomicrobia bacterium]|nr:TonB-dependent receptor [Verrucomicrobiota bacterium]
MRTQNDRSAGVRWQFGGIALLWLGWTAGRLAAADPGEIQGRVFNVAVGNYVSNARVAVAGTNLETFTDGGGAYQLSRVPAGEVTLVATYAGLASQSAKVTVGAGQVVRRDFDLEPGASEGGVVLLDAVSVAAERMSAQAISLNERKHAANIRNVVAVGEFGDSGDGNAAELLKYMPGISIEYSSTVARGISVRGLPSSGTLVTIDGGEVANGTSGGTGRNVELDAYRLNNISRVEVTKVPTPDLPANAQGGAVNVISKSGFERKSPLFSYKAYATFNSRGFETTGLHRRQGSRPDLSTGPFQPGFNLNYELPVNKSLAFAFAAGHTSRFNRYREVFSNRDLATLALSMTDIVPGERITQASDVALTAEWRLGAHSTFRANVLWVDGVFKVNDNRLRLLYGAGATGGETFVQGAATGVGSAALSFPTAHRFQRTGQYNFNYRYHRGPWRAEFNGSAGRDRIGYRDVERGYFGDANINLPNLVLRGQAINRGSAQPMEVSAFDRAGNPVDIFEGGNYTINSVDSSYGGYNVTDAKDALKLDLTREFGAVGPLSLFTMRVGAAYNHQERDLRRDFKRWSFRPTGTAADRLAKNYDLVDREYSATAMPYYPGRTMQWISTVKLYDLYRSNPGYFVLQDGTSYAQNVLFSKNLQETITAGYVRADAKFLHNRLWLVGGVRYEKTEDEGKGPLTDPSAVYVKDSAGRLVRDAQGRLIPITTDAQARQLLLYKNRGSRTLSDYAGYYPSLNSTLAVTEDILLRAAFARTMGRPNLAEIIPGVTISDPSAVTRTINVVNTALKPWTSDGYDLSLETYNVKGGVGTVGVFSKRIKDFFGVLQTAATPATLAQYDIPEEFPDQYTGYNIITKQNVGDAEVNGFEISYKQDLFFLPAWARGLQAHFNYTELRLKGANTADFTGYTPRTLNWGVSYSRPKYSARFNVNQKSRVRSALQAPSAAIPANTYNWFAPRTLVGADFEYRFSKRFSFYASAINLFDAEAITERYSTTVAVPEWAKVIRRFKFGADFNLGIKGSF